MSKKSLIAIAIIFVLGIGGFVGYINYTNNKDSNAETQIATSNEKDEEGNYTDTKGMTDIEIEQMKATEVFNLVMNTVWNVPDTKDEVAMADVRSVIENNITGKEKTTLDTKYYSKVNSLAIQSFDIIKVRPGTLNITTENKTLDVIFIYYKFKGVADGNKEFTIINNEKVDFSTAAMAKAEDGSYKMIRLAVGGMSE